MDIKIEMKEGEPLSDNVAPQNERELPTKNVRMMINNDFDKAVKSEVKSKSAFPYFCTQRFRKYCAKHAIKQIASESVIISSKNCDLGVKTEVEEQTLVSETRVFFPEDPEVKDKKYNSDHEGDNKIEIKEEPLWLETEASSLCNDCKDGDIPPGNSLRLCMEDISGDGSGKLTCIEILEREASFYNGKDQPKPEIQESDITEMPTLEDYLHSKQSDKCSAGGEMCSNNLKKISFIHKNESPHKCNICEKNFTQLSSLKMHRLIHEGKKPYHCKTCEKSFTRLTHLKMHNFIHEGRKPHQCKTCDKSFTQLSDLKRHSLIHEGRKPHHCKTCDKSFTDMSNLKQHSMIHEGRKPHQCKVCDKSFSKLSDLKRHNLIHEGRKPHQCKTCEKSFTLLSHLKRHNFIHEGNKPHQCKTCNKNFTQFSDLKRHNLIHESKKSH